MEKKQWGDEEDLLKIVNNQWKQVETGCRKPAQCKSVSPTLKMPILDRK